MLGERQRGWRAFARLHILHIVYGIMCIYSQLFAERGARSQFEDVTSRSRQRTLVQAHSVAVDCDNFPNIYLLSPHTTALIWCRGRRANNSAPPRSPDSEIISQRGLIGAQHRTHKFAISGRQTTHTHMCPCVSVLVRTNAHQFTLPPTHTQTRTHTRVHIRIRLVTLVDSP